MDHINIIYNDISIDELENRLSSMAIIPSKTKGVVIAAIKPGTNNLIEILNQFKDITVLTLSKYHSTKMIGPISKLKHVSKLHVIQDYVETPNLKISSTISELHFILSRKILGSQITNFFDYAGAGHVNHLLISKSSNIEHWFEIDLPDNISKITLIEPSLGTEINAWFASNGFIMWHRTLMDITYIKQ